MKVREIRYLCVPSLIIEIYPLGMYGTGNVYFRGLVEDIPKILFEEEVLSILPLYSYVQGISQGISIEYDENIMKEITSSKKEDEQ